MAASDKTVTEVVRVIRRHVSAEVAQRMADELRDVPGNKSFRDTIEKIAAELEAE